MIMNIPVKKFSNALLLLIAVMVVVLGLSARVTWAASPPTKVTIHIPSKSLALMPFYFGKDKGFFPREAVEIQLVTMGPPTAIVALVAGELDFSTTLGAATSAIMQGHPLRRIFYVQHEPAHVLMGQPEIKNVQELAGKVLGVNALTDATGMAARLILRGNGVDPSRVTFLAAQVTETLYKTLTSRKVAAAMMTPPFSEELEAQGYNRLAAAKTYAPLSFIGLVASTATLTKNSAKAQALIAGLLKTLAYLHDPANRKEVVQYIAAFHKIDPPLAEKAFASILPTFSKDGTKPRQAVEKEIEIYREALKIARPFTPDDLEEMGLLRKIREAAAPPGQAR